MDPILWSAVCAVVGVLAGVVGMLWRELARQRKRDEDRILKLETELDEARAAYLVKLEGMTTWVLGLEEKEHARVMALATITEVVQKRIPR